MLQSANNIADYRAMCVCPFPREHPLSAWLLFQGADLSEVMSSIRISPAGQVVSANDDPARQYAWEQGQIDYLGVDKFENIQKRLDKAMTDPPPPDPEKTASPFSL